MPEPMTKDPTRAEVYIGDFLADAVLRDGEIHFKITGSNISPRLFAQFVRNPQTMKFVAFEGPFGGRP